MSKHTPGLHPLPWRAETPQEQRNGVVYVLDARGLPVAACYGNTPKERQETCMQIVRAVNAERAAPEMLEALRGLLGAIGDAVDAGEIDAGLDNCAAALRARAAIARAEGRET